MAIRLDHLIVPSRNQVQGAKSLAGLLDVPWAELQGTFSPVYVNEGCTVDFATRDRFESHHFCFSVSDTEFDPISARPQAAATPSRGPPRAENVFRVTPRLGGKNVYGEAADGPLGEILTISYARPESPSLAAAG